MNIQCSSSAEMRSSVSPSWRGGGVIGQKSAGFPSTVRTPHPKCGEWHSLPRSTPAESATSWKSIGIRRNSVKRAEPDATANAEERSSVGDSFSVGFSIELFALLGAAALSVRRKRKWHPRDRVALKAGNLLTLGTDPSRDARRVSVATRCVIPVPVADFD